MPKRNVGFALVFVLGVSAVEPGLPSKTSLFVTYHRAIGAKNPDTEFRNPDDLAIKFLGPRERAILAEHPMDALDMDFDAAIKRHPNPPMVAWMLSRTRYMDDALLEAFAGGTRQIVILGAGFDSRAYRFRDKLTGVKFFVLDYGPTQAYKKRRVVEIFGSVPGHVVYVPVDFTRDDLATELRKHGYLAKDRSLFIWEGVTMYLPEQAIRNTLRTFHKNAAPGSTIAFDYALNTHPGVGASNSMHTRWGEPWIFGFQNSGAAEFVRSEGLEIIEDVLSSAPRSLRYIRRADGSSSLPQPSADLLSKIGRCKARVPYIKAQPARKLPKP